MGNTLSTTALALGICLAPATAFAADRTAHIEGGSFRSVLPPIEGVAEVEVKDFILDGRPVTNQEFLAFVTRNPEWRRGKAGSLFADENYLVHWAGPLTLGDDAGGQQPVVNVSWFAARSYCESQGGRLPAWYEWEYVAAASDVERDARNDPAWRQEILGWYSQTGGKTLPDVGRNAANVYGVQDMHGLVWEWVEDFNALLVSSDNREQGGADKLQFCGAGAATMEEKENYAILMRTAMLSSLDGRDTTRNMGFRCAHDIPGESK